MGERSDHPRSLGYPCADPLRTQLLGICLRSLAEWTVLKQRPSFITVEVRMAAIPCAGARVIGVIDFVAEVANFLAGDLSENCALATAVRGVGEVCLRFMRFLHFAMTSRITNGGGSCGSDCCLTIAG